MSGVLSGWLQGLFWAAGGAGLIVAGAAVAAHSAFTDWMDPAGGIQELAAWIDAEDTLSNLRGLFSLLSIALFVLLIVWTYKAHRTAESLAPGARRWSSGWAIGAWFIPLANAILPKLVIDETQKIVTAPRVQGCADPSWRSGRVDPLGWWWWGCFMVMYVLVVIAGVTNPDIDTATESSLKTHYVLTALAYLTASAAGVLGALYVRRASKPMSPSAMAQS